MVCMPRRKGQTDSDLAGAWVRADDLPPSRLPSYMCSAGPRFCPICFSRCAFGERYLALRRAERGLTKEGGEMVAGKLCTAPAGR
jgi:hypothetical protein